MNDPIYILFRPALDDNIYLQYIDDLKEYRASQKGALACYEKLYPLLNKEEKKLLDALIDEDTLETVTETKAAFTAGLAFGLQLMRLS